ncbi:hypothetical protein ACFWIB_14540 [Streptomyces sp. NPDC127051]|uniref:hypothetical protein n=1 Tax=Streptomyces sp. NPDC127051 TaxID=3347119 RepID=UPI0036522075
MATYTSRTVTSTRREWIVPAAQPWGAAWEEIDKAILAAWDAYRTHHRLPLDAAIPGDFARFSASDDEIVISFTVEAAS